jgi:hypothetical protein
MISAKITSDQYRCCPDGTTIKTFKFGETVYGKVADWAVSDRSAQYEFNPVEEKKVVFVDEVKVAPKPRSRKGKANGATKSS